jgi:DNA-3-methyladenine glycosylase II
MVALPSGAVIGALDAAGFAAAARHLAGTDPDLGRIVEERGLPAFWHRPPGFATLALLIVEQQVSLASARAVFERLQVTLGQVTAARLVAAEPSALAGAGLTRQKQRYLRDLAAAVVGRELQLEALESLDDASARATLLSRSGIGPWTADVYLLTALRRPDIWPVGDRALQVGVGERLGLGATPDPALLEDIGDRWRPHRAVAARLIWHDYLARRGRVEPEVAGLEFPEPGMVPD